MRYVRSLALFVWNFIVGDDWRTALGLASALAAVWLFARDGHNVWWLLPAAVSILLVASVLREASSSTKGQ
jgi:drug/metabolite transporter superfamily protein YnfA